jgi:SulP family sulfate permease
LPKAVLAAIIMVAVFSLLDFSVPKQLLKYSKRDLVILNVTLLVTAAIGIKEGILTGVILSLSMLIYKSSKPHIAILGKIPNTHFYRNKERFKDVEIDERILIIRFDAQLHFANTTYFKDKLQEFAKYKGDNLRLLIIEGESLNNVDSSAIYAISEILDYFHSKNVEVFFSGLKGPVRDTFDKSDIIYKIGVNNCFISIQEAVDSYESMCNDKPVTKKYQKYTKQSNK